MTAYESTTPTEEKRDEQTNEAGDVIGHTDTLTEAESPLDLSFPVTMIALRGEGVHATDLEADVDVVVDGDSVELRLAATLEDVEQLAGRDLFWAEIGAKDLPDEPEDDDE